MKTSDTAQPTVLVVDDNAMMSAFLESFIGMTYRVIAKEDGQQALSCLESGTHVDLVLTDIHMPHMDGISLLKYLRARPQWAHVPIVMLSSEENSAVRVECLHQGADDFVIKPFNPDELLVRLGKMFARTAYA